MQLDERHMESPPDDPWGVKDTPVLPISVERHESLRERCGGASGQV